MTDLADDRGRYGGWFCPCRGLEYDSLDDTRKDPAPLELTAPPYATAGTTTKTG